MSRHQRQQAEILATVRAGDLRRALALSREHLAEFPADTIVREAIIDGIGARDDHELQDELRDLLANAPA